MTRPSQMPLLENAAIASSDVNNAILPNQLKQMQQSIQSGQDMGQVLQAVLSQTAAMQGNLTTILTAITTLMQQQQQQQQQHQQQQMKQEQGANSVSSPQVQAAPTASLPEMGSQASPNPIPAFSDTSKTFLATSNCLDSPALSNSFLPQNLTSPPITNVNSPAVHSSVRVFNPSASSAEPLHSVSVSSSQTFTVASNFGHEMEGPDASKSMSHASAPVPSVPMDVDALLQQILGETPKHSDPVLGSTKFDVQESLVSQTPVMSASVSNSHFVDSLLNQPLPTEDKNASSMERQLSHNTSNGNSNSSTLRSLLTENSWLNASSKANDSIIMNSEAASSDSVSLYSNPNVSTSSRVSYLPTSVTEHIANPSPLNTALNADEEDQVSTSSSAQLETNVPKQHLLEMQPGSSMHPPHFDEVSNSSAVQLNDAAYQEEHDSQCQLLKFQKMDEESQHSVEFKPFVDSNDIPGHYSKHDLTLRKARDGDSSGDESSPSCSPSSSRCGSPYMSRNSPDFMASEVTCQVSNQNRVVVSLFHLAICSSNPKHWRVADRCVSSHSPWKGVPNAFRYLCPILILTSS